MDMNLCDKIKCRNVMEPGTSTILLISIKTEHSKFLVNLKFTDRITESVARRICRPSTFQTFLSKKTD